MSTVALQHPVNMVPAWEPKGQWLSVPEYARITGRSASTVRNWCRPANRHRGTGTLSAFGVPHFKDGRGRWWIKYIA